MIGKRSRRRALADRLARRRDIDTKRGPPDAAGLRLALATRPVTAYRPADPAVMYANGSAFAS